MSFTSAHPYRVLRAIVTVAALTAIAVATTATPRADALPSHCKTTREAINSWDDPSDDDSVSTKELRELRRLIKALDSCKRSIPVLPEDTAEQTERAEPTDSVYRGMGKNATRWRQLVAEYFKVSDVDRVVCLIDAESGGNPNARNKRTGAAGLMQVMPFWADAVGVDYDRLFEPTVNLWLARHVYELQGWTAWSPYRRGVCRN